MAVFAALIVDVVIGINQGLQEFAFPNKRRQVLLAKIGLFISWKFEFRSDFLLHQNPSLFISLERKLVTKRSHNLTFTMPFNPLAISLSHLVQSLPTIK